MRVEHTAARAGGGAATIMDDELRALLSAVKRKLDEEAAAPEATATVLDVWTKYAASPEATGMRAWKTEEGRGKHLLRILGDRRISALTLADVDTYRKKRETERFLRKQATRPATRNREVVRLVRAINWAVERKIIPANPIAGAPPEPEENIRRTMRTAEEIETIVDELDPVTAAIVVTAGTSGLRRQEVTRLQRNQLDTSGGQILLHHLDTKTRKPRVTVLSQWASDMIRAMPRDVRWAKSPYVFVSRLGRPLNPRTVLRRYQEACRAVGVEAADGEANWFHDLRSHFIDEQLELGTPERDIRDMSGHSHRNTSAFERYVRRHRQKAAVALAKERLDLATAKRRAPKRKLPMASNEDQKINKD